MLIKKGVLLTIAAASIFAFQTKEASANSVYTVKEGDSLWNIGKEYGVSVVDLKNVNQLESTKIYPGQKFTLPSSISSEDRQLLAQLVHAEAKGEPYAGKVAVATVVLNRVDHGDFPDSVKEVIYQKVNGHYAFTPVQTGTINERATQEDYEAVNEALAFNGQGQGSVFFYNPDTSSSKWVFSRQTTITIGNHVFAK
ncbi:N-acetylmuramoyl-L-alanine amidase [Bacillus pakistanensis]|uniref:N-acetylmuramoyl-L-alanine amidase n=1 Tax=Rossellomorea pakistanensis TaxID=992288 RepID=A0ABS2NFJ4_9BACI|nr:cell wall hydrolase [Bacillus pakistanensis]MBM7586625.1 N-acetylmuramoyl-L-alanine amidase [Bacillus pakistanensis]